MAASDHNNEDPPIEPTLDPADDARQGQDDDFATIDSSIQQRPEADPEQTIDSSIQKRPSEPLPTTHGATTPQDEAFLSDVSTILPIDDDVETMEGIDALPPKGPERIAKFRLLGVIGTGGMGKVYLAVQDRPRRHVAIKVMKPGITGEQALRRFEFEAELLARLVHPGIAQIYEAGTWDGGEGPTPYFAM